MPSGNLTLHMTVIMPMSNAVLTGGWGNVGWGGGGEMGWGGEMGGGIFGFLFPRLWERGAHAGYGSVPSLFPQAQFWGDSPGAFGAQRFRRPAPPPLYCSDTKKINWVNLFTYRTLKNYFIQLIFDALQSINFTSFDLVPELTNLKSCHPCPPPQKKTLPNLPWA
jgi:hypothetical protein